MRLARVKLHASVLFDIHEQSGQRIEESVDVLC